MGLTRTLMTGLLVLFVVGMGVGILSADPQGFVDAQTAKPVPLREEGAVAVLVAHNPKTADGRYTITINVIAPTLGEEGRHVVVQCSVDAYRHWKDGDNILIKAIFQGGHLVNVALRTEDLP